MHIVVVILQSAGGALFDLFFECKSCRGYDAWSTNSSQSAFSQAVTLCIYYVLRDSGPHARHLTTRARVCRWTLNVESSYRTDSDNITVVWKPEINSTVATAYNIMTYSRLCTTNASNFLLLDHGISRLQGIWQERATADLRAFALHNVVRMTCSLKPKCWNNTGDIGLYSSTNEPNFFKFFFS